MRSLAFAAAAALILTTAQTAGSVTTDTGAPAATGSEAVSTAAAATSAANPFSDPIWYPLRVEAQVGCGHSNPGCDKPHDFWTQILTPTGQKSGGTSQGRITSMGHGIAHIGEANGPGCGSGDASFGTWVWVDHGGGVISRYGHLSQILISEGQLVSPGEPVGIVGTTGKRSSDSCFRAYLDFQLKRHGVRGDDFEFPTLQACQGSTRQTWPTAVHGTTSWNTTTQGLIMPANSDDCIPTATPATTGRPTGVGMSSPGTGRLKVSWTSAGGTVDKVRLELARFRPGTGTYEDRHKGKWKDVAGSATSGTFKGLVSGSKYRVRVHFHTAGVGWSLPSGYVRARAK
ncbi:MAG: peptidoglycan DD-metalloendopeptidase family protein [Sporichthyaceae bacterium]